MDVFRCYGGCGPILCDGSVPFLSFYCSYWLFIFLDSWDALAVTKWMLQIISLYWEWKILVWVGCLGAFCASSRNETGNSSYLLFWFPDFSWDRRIVLAKPSNIFWKEYLSYVRDCFLGFPGNLKMFLLKIEEFCVPWYMVLLLEQNQSLVVDEITYISDMFVLNVMG